MANIIGNDMDLITDMFDVTYDDIIEEDKEDSYYIGKAENILKQMPNNDNYFHFLITMLKRYHDLDTDKKEIINNMILIQEIPTEMPKVKAKAKVNTSKKNKKPKLNTYDDY